MNVDFSWRSYLKIKFYNTENVQIKTMNIISNAVP